MSRPKGVKNKIKVPVVTPAVNNKPGNEEASYDKREASQDEPSPNTD